MSAFIQMNVRYREPIPICRATAMRRGAVARGADEQTTRGRAKRRPEV